MFKILAVMIGGGIGAFLRYGLFVLVQRAAGPGFPAGTLAANLIGSLFIGFLWNLFDDISFTHELRLFVFTGLLGGFTTFSTFTRETAQLFEAGAWKTALVYLGASNFLGILFVFFGYSLYKILPLMTR